MVGSDAAAAGKGATNVATKPKLDSRTTNLRIRLLRARPAGHSRAVRSAVPTTSPRSPGVGVRHAGPGLGVDNPAALLGVPGKTLLLRLSIRPLLRIVTITSNFGQSNE